MSITDTQSQNILYMTCTKPRAAVNSDENFFEFFFCVVQKKKILQNICAHVLVFTQQHTHLCKFVPHTHARMHARTHARTHACTHARMHAHIHMQGLFHTYTHSHARTHVHIYTHICKIIEVYRLRCLCPAISPQDMSTRTKMGPRTQT